MSGDFKIRLATSEDQDQVIRLIDSVYSEYGDTVCLDGAEADLLDLQGKYFDAGGAFWVLQRGDEIVASHGALPDPTQANVCNFKRLYLDSSLRGTGWGYKMMQVTIDWAKENGFDRVEFWSDTRFERAHRFFEKLNFVKTGESRDMDDGIEPYSEYFYFLEL